MRALVVTRTFPFPTHLKDLLAGHLNATVAGLRLLLRQFLAKDLELLNKISLVLGHREALGLLGELTGGHQSLLGLILQLVLTTAGERSHGKAEENENGPKEGDRKTHIACEKNKQALVQE